MIEIMRVRLAPGVDETEFLKIDKTFQEEFAYQQAGLLRRTTARGANGTWIVIDLWRSEADADACAAIWDEAALPRQFMSLVDRSSVVVERFESLA